MTIPPRLSVLLALSALLSACTGLLDGEPLGAIDDFTGADGDDPLGRDPGADDNGDDKDDSDTTQAAGLPCAVEDLLGTYCTSCHNGSVADLAPMPLLTRLDLLAPSPSDPNVSVGEMSVRRMLSDERPMPPGAPLPAEIAKKLEAWVQDGMPAEVCMDETTEPPLPFEAASIYSATRTVKNLLTGLAPSRDELAAVTANPDALRDLIDVWMARPEFEQKMLAFFIKAFQQTELTPESFFDQFGRRIAGNNATISRLIENVEQSFARTALDIVQRGRPFHETVTTRTFMMTPALMSFYTILDERFVNDQLRVSEPNLSFDLRTTGTAIPFTQSVDPSSPSFMKFTAIGSKPSCAETSFSATRHFELVYMFLGRFFGPNNCNTNVPSAYTDADFETFRPITVRAPRAGETLTRFYELPKLRNASELALNIPRVGFFSTPAFFANWATNDSNEMRVTANQTLIVALGASFDGSDSTVPVTEDGLAEEHADPSTACYSCHKTLDPMRQFFKQSFTLGYHEQRDTAQQKISGAFLFEGATDQGKGIDVLAKGLANHERFASAWAQKLCYYATSERCVTDDPEFVRIADQFRASGFDFKTLVRELFSSPLVTVLANTKTFETRNPVVSISRQDHLCSALSLRLGIADACGLGINVSTPNQRAAQVVAQSIPADAYSRGSEVPVVLSDTNLFFRGATESLCSTISSRVVDAGATSKYKSSDAQAAILDMVHNVMGFASTDPREEETLSVLREHHAEALAQGIGAADALRSTFVLSCTASATVAIGL